MKVGDYVRTHDGRIDKIVDIKNDFIYIENSDYGYRENYLKSSPNIIDLIEVGDYVNGYLIDYIDSERRYLRSERPYREDSTMYKDLIEKGRNYNQCLHFFAEDIKSIVTKEQFGSMEYKVGE